MIYNQYRFANFQWLRRWFSTLVFRFLWKHFNCISFTLYPKILSTTFQIFNIHQEFKIYKLNEVHYRWDFAYLLLWSRELFWWKTLCPTFLLYHTIFPFSICLNKFTYTLFFVCKNHLYKIPSQTHYIQTTYDKCTKILFSVSSSTRVVGLDSLSGIISLVS